MKLRLPWLLSLAIMLLAVPLGAQEDRVPFNRFGVVEGFWLPEDVCEVGAGWERIIFDWSQHQPTGPEDWNTLNVDQRWLEAAAVCDREVVAILKNTPAWATDGEGGAALPRGLSLPFDDPNNLWASFVRKAAEYYAPFGVRRFIIWNEPDITPETYGFEFAGTLDDYAQMLKVSYLAANAGNPDALIHMAGTTYWHDVNEGRRLYVDRLLEHLQADPDAAANDYYFDALTLHIYFRTDTVYQIVSETQEILDRYGLSDKAIWIDETNASPNLDPAWPVTRPQYQITLEQQSAFLLQAVGLGLAGGADAVGVYKFYDWNLPPGDESFGLVRADASRRPAFDTWAMITSTFSDVESAALAQTEQTNIVRLVHADGSQTLLAWSRNETPVALAVTATGENAQLGDQYGNMVTLSPLENRYLLLLPGALCTPSDGCAVGGRVSVLQQPTGAFDVFEIESTTQQHPLIFGDERSIDGADR